MPFELPREVRFHAVELAFDKLPTTEASSVSEGLSTSFALPRAQVTLLRQVARQLLLASADFRAAMTEIAPDWQPREVTIDPALIAEACGKS